MPNKSSDDMSLTAAMRCAIDDIKQQDPDEYVANVKKHQHSPIATTIQNVGPVLVTPNTTNKE